MSDQDHRSVEAPRHLSLGRARVSGPALVTAALLVVLTALVLVVVLRQDPAPDRAPDASVPESVAPQEVVGVAQDAQVMLQTWARPGTPYDQWWERLEPLLSPAAREAYAGTDPALLPDLGDLRDPQVDSSYGPDSVAVWFETDQGRFGVDVARAAQGQPWRMVRVLFPGQESSFA